MERSATPISVALPPPPPSSLFQCRRRLNWRVCSSVDPREEGALVLSALARHEQSLISARVVPLHLGPGRGAAWTAARTTAGAWRCGLRRGQGTGPWTGRRWRPPEGSRRGPRPPPRPAVSLAASGEGRRPSSLEQRTVDATRATCSFSRQEHTS